MTMGDEGILNFSVRSEDEKKYHTGDIIPLQAKNVC